MEINKSEKSKTAQKKDTSILLISIVVFIFFAITILLAKLKYNVVLIGIIREMLTIPALILLGITIILSLLSFIKEKYRINDLPFYSLLIQMVTIGLLVYIA